MEQRFPPLSTFFFCDSRPTNVTIGTQILVTEHLELRDHYKIYILHVIHDLLFTVLKLI